MSAPVTERPRGALRTAPRPARVATPVIPAQRGSGERGARATRGAQQAYARRDERLRRLVGGTRGSGPATPRRAQFVLLVMALLGTGLVLTLWLSTAAAADSYRLQDARAEAGVLAEQSEQLRREVAFRSSAPELARRATELGMVATQNPARLVVAPDGTVTVVGEPQVARAPAPPVVVAPAPVPAPETPAEAPAAQETAEGAVAPEAAAVEPGPVDAAPAPDAEPAPEDPAVSADQQAAAEPAAAAAAADTGPSAAPN